jgi:hypothetical protein
MYADRLQIDRLRVVMGADGKMQMNRLRVVMDGLQVVMDESDWKNPLLRRVPGTGPAYFNHTLSGFALSFERSWDHMHKAN